MDQRASSILEFWFGIDTERGRPRKAWFAKNEAFDESIRERFLALYEQAASGRLAAWRDRGDECLALIVLLDQFPRNMFRNSGRAYAADGLALGAARHAIARGYDLEMLPVERQFIYLPFEHSESIDDQRFSCDLMAQLKTFPETADLHLWALKHLEIIQRFGRFPQRNAALERASTPAEEEYIRQPGSGF